MNNGEVAVSTLYSQALDELKTLFHRVDDEQVDAAVNIIAKANQIALYGVGREGLQIKGLAMRLFHLGLKVAVVGDMTTPALGEGDLLIVSAGPGSFSTVNALIGEAHKAGAKVMCITAQPEGASAVAADYNVTIPAQTMADDMGSEKMTADGGELKAQSILPMGSLFEGAQYILFEVMILKLKALLSVSTLTMRSHHTNLE